MADTEKTASVEESVEEKDVETKTEEQGEKTFTQEQVNKLVGEARKKERSKYSDYNDLKKELAQMKDLQSNFEEVSNELAGLKKEKQVAEWKSNAAKEFGVDPAVLRGDTEEEINEHAEALKAHYSYSKVDLSGVPKNSQVAELSDRDKSIQSMGGLVYVD